MKYNTMGSSTNNVNGEGKKSTLTIYADLNITSDKNKNTTSSMENEITTLKEELLKAQIALKKQTRRCRQLVEEFTKKLQDQEILYEHEKNLREDQLAKVLRALLLVEARLKQEQKLIAHQLMEKDLIIQKQDKNLKMLLASQYCRNCSQFYNSSNNPESLDSSSDIRTDYQESNLGSFDSSSEIYGTSSEKETSNNLDDGSVSKDTESNDKSSRYLKKEKGKDSLDRKIKKITHKKSIGTYFEVLKLRNDNISPYSNEDNTSNDYDNFDSLPTESCNDHVSIISQESETELHDEKNDIDTKNNLSISESNLTVIHNTIKENEIESNEIIEEIENKRSTIIPIFDDEIESNDKWYVNASDQEDEQQNNIYRNNPVLECVNQILLQNINDNLNSPPKTPNIERKLTTTKNKKVKFSDEEIQINKEESSSTSENHNYYETPVQNHPNYYETPQSIYSNDYEQILNRCSETFSSTPKIDEILKNNVVRRNKILRNPPALPPKPANLVSKYKIQNAHLIQDKGSDAVSLDSEPDYCSISEINLPKNDNPAFKKIQVIAEINTTPPKITENVEQLKENDDSNHYDLESNNMITKNIDKVNIRIAKQTTINSEDLILPIKNNQEIPKLPQVSEIIIPEDKEEMISQDNYIKNNSQLLKNKNLTPNRTPISIGTSVSSLIMGFNNRELMYELNKNSVKPPITPSKKINSTSTDCKINDDFDLNQNFEEFKLDDCELDELTDSIEKSNNETKIISSEDNSSDIIMPQLNRRSLEILKQQLEKQTKDYSSNRCEYEKEPVYEHFLECTGLSSKSILTPSRMTNNHKTVLKPKDIKLRSKTKNSSIKYWTEPFL